MFSFISIALAGSADDGVCPQVVKLAQELAAFRAADAPALPDQAYLKALAGTGVSGVTAVKGQAAGKAWAVGVVSAPIEAAWMAINDESRMAGRMPVEVSAVIGGTPKSTPRRVFEYLPLPLVSDRWWVVDMHANADLYRRSGGKLWELSWTDATDPAALVGTSHQDKAAEGFPVAWTKGSWLLMDLGDGRTLVEHYSCSDPGGSVPAGLASRFGGGALRDALAAVGELAAEAEALSRAGFTRPDGSEL